MFSEYTNKVFIEYFSDGSFVLDISWDKTWLLSLRIQLSTKEVRITIWEIIKL